MYLVSNHLGSDYLSDGDYADITQRCDTCGDSDSIVFSFSPELAVQAVLDYHAESSDDEYWYGPSSFYFATLLLSHNLLTNTEFMTLAGQLGWEDFILGNCVECGTLLTTDDTIRYSLVIEGGRPDKVLAQCSKCYHPNGPFDLPNED